MAASTRLSGKDPALVRRGTQGGPSWPAEVGVERSIAPESPTYLQPEAGSGDAWAAYELECCPRDQSFARREGGARRRARDARDLGCLHGQPFAARARAEGREQEPAAALVSGEGLDCQGRHEPGLHRRQDRVRDRQRHDRQVRREREGPEDVARLRQRAPRGHAAARRGAYRRRGRRRAQPGAQRRARAHGVQAGSSTTA